MNPRAGWVCMACGICASVVSSLLTYYLALDRDPGAPLVLRLIIAAFLTFAAIGMSIIKRRDMGAK